MAQPSLAEGGQGLGLPAGFIPISTTRGNPGLTDHGLSLVRWQVRKGPWVGVAAAVLHARMQHAKESVAGLTVLYQPERKQDGCRVSSARWGASVIGQDWQSPCKGEPGRAGSTALAQGEQEMCPKGPCSPSGDPRGFPEQHCQQVKWTHGRQTRGVHLGHSTMLEGRQG